MLAVLLLVCAVGRNAIARFAAIEVGSRLLATRIEIDSIDIGWNAILVTDTEIFEPNASDQRQLTVDRVRLVPSIWQGLKTGVWLSEIAVSSPTAEVRFDQHGNLVSVFPKGGETSESTGPIRIPVAKISVSDAALIVHQVGRDSFHIANVDLQLTADDRVKLVLAVPDLLGSQCEVKCDVDAQTFAGVSMFTVDHLHLDTTNLAKLPLVPTEVAAEPISIDSGIKIVAHHPANQLDPRKHTLQLHAWMSNAQSDSIGMICEHFDLAVKCEGGRVDAKVVAVPLAGTLECESTIDLMAATPELLFKSTLTNCQPAALAKVIPELSNLHTDTTFSTRWNVAFDKDTLRFRGNAKANLAESLYESVSFPVVNASVEVDGSVQPSDLASLSGEIRGSINSETFDLADLARSLGAPPMDGEVVARSNFAIPLNTIADLETYSANADVTIRAIAASGLYLDDASISAQLASGVATVDLKKFVVRDAAKNLLAELQSTTTVSLNDGGGVTSSSLVFAEPSTEILRLTGLEKVDPSGRVIAQVNASCPLDQISSPNGWQAETRVQTQTLSALGETISDIDWQAKLAGGNIQCTPLHATWRGHTLEFNTSAVVGPEISVLGDLSLDSVRLAEISEVLSRYSSTRLPLNGLGSVKGAFKFTRNLVDGDQSLAASGKAELSNSSYAFTKIGDATLSWAATLDGLTLTTSSKDFLGGEFSINARMNELDWTRTHVDGNFHGVEVSRLAHVARQDLPTTGTVDGSFRVTSIASIESLTGDAWIGTKQMSVERLPMQVNRATITVDQGALSIDANGSLVDGTFIAKAGGSLPQVIQFLGQEAAPIEQIPLTADVMFTGFRPESLVRPLGLPREARGLSARISAHCIRSSAAWDGRHLCTASATVEDLRYNHQGLSQRMSVETVLHTNRLEVSRILGRFADGTLSGSGEISLDQTPTGRFDLSANHVNLRRAASPLGINNVSGTGTLRVRGRIGPVINGQLDATVDNLNVAGVAVRKAKFPVDWSFRPVGNLARWQCRAGTVSVGGGSVRIASEGSYSGGLSATTSVRLEKIDLAKLMQSGSAGSGTIDGIANLRAKNARSVDDLVGTFAIEMQNIQAMQIPVLDQLPKMITLSPPVPGRGQDGGTIRGRISGGLVHLDEAAIYQSNVQVLVSGNATLAGRLNLDVVASTESTSPTDQLISLLDSPVMLAAPAPVALVVKANELLKDRVVRVHVGGTTDRPTLRLQPGKQLSQDAVRFFLSSSLGPAADRLSELQLNSRSR